MLETTTQPTPASVPTILSPDERAVVRAALLRVRAARCTTEDEAISMTWEIRDEVIEDLTQAIELLKKLVN